MPVNRRRAVRPADAPERWIVYSRQSDTDGDRDQSLSLDSQERALRDVAVSRGAVVVAAVRDADLKGYQDETQRPALADALAMADRGEADVLAVWELSRLARKLSLQERVLERLEGAGVRLYSHQEPWTSDPLVRQILGAVAEQQTRTIAGHVRRAIRERMQRGLWNGRAPYGYDVVDGRLVPDPERAPWVLALFERYRDGDHIAALVRWLRDAGAPPTRHMTATSPWRWFTVRKMLTSPAYIGTLRSGPIVVEDAHPAIIPPDLWAAVQERLAREVGTGTGTRHGRADGVETFLRDGIGRCGCGLPLYTVGRGSDERQDRLLCSWGPNRFEVPRCTHRPRSIGVATAEDVVRAQLAADLATLRPWRVVAAELRREERARQPDPEVQRKAAERRRDDLAGRRARARDLYIAGRITLDEFDQSVAPLDAALAETEAEIARLLDGRAVDLAAFAGAARRLRDGVFRAEPAVIGRFMRHHGIIAVLTTDKRRPMELVYPETIQPLLAGAREGSAE